MLRLVLLVRRLAVTGCTLATCLLCFAPPLAGQGSEPKPEAKPDPGPTPWYQAVSFNGFVSVSDTHNFNRPDSRTNQFRVFDFDAGSIKLDVAELVVQKPATDRGQAGFRVDATFGSSIPRVAASAGLFRDAQGVAGDFDIHQAFASYVVQVGKGLRLDAGKFITFLGYEVIDGYDGYNENASRSFLFGYAIPARTRGCASPTQSRAGSRAS